MENIMINKKTKEFVNIIETGKVEEIKDYAISNIYQVKHRQPFMAIIDRLNKKENVNEKI